ncbi:hypothetical protein RIR_jg37915.t1 [Rhizophagus irregularis DAOM 181602=DAOM 197198]|nr:hypothetical protein RIR_jg37915.t1 [Rhizophagus irregularis DAOM 181602=DAOM 197198]
MQILFVHFIFLFFLEPECCSRLLISKVLEAESQVPDFSFRRFWKPKVKFRTPHFEGSRSRKSNSGLLILKVLEAESQVPDSSFRRFWKPKVKFRTPHFEGCCQTNNTNQTLEFRFLDLDEPGLWNYVAGFLDEPGLWNYVSCRMNNTNRTSEFSCRTFRRTRTLELCYRTNNTNRTLEFRLNNYVAGRIIRTGLWNLGCRLLDEPSSTNFHKLWDFGIMLPDFRCTWTLELCYRTFG